MKNSQRAFTLIELLVVIAIIGLLSSIILASLSSARAKAAIAAGETQESNIHNSIGDAGVLQIDFDQFSGTTVYDSSGYGYNGTLQHGASLVTTTYNNKGDALSLDAASQQYVKVLIGTAPLLDISGDVTLTAWIDPSSSGSNECIVRGGIGADERYSLYYNASNQKLSSEWYDGAAFRSVNATGGAIAYNTWAFVVMVRTGSVINFYVDGVLVGTGAFTSAPVAASELEIGAAAGASAPYTGLIDEVRVYSRSITSDAVKQMYLAEAPMHGRNVALR